MFSNIFIRGADQIIVIMANLTIKYSQNTKSLLYTYMSVVSRLSQPLPMGARLTIGCKNTTTILLYTQLFNIHNVVLELCRFDPCPG